MDYLVGQPRITEALRNALTRDRLGHGLLFLGASGVGRERAALGLASGLLCAHHNDASALPWGCGSCSACRRARAATHPDVHLVMSEAEAVRRGRAEPDGKRRPSPDILVDAMRELAGRLRMTSFEGGARVAIVLDAHRMNVNAQNALLKTLEEPGDGTVVILLAPHERALLPTIVSRCLRLVFAPLAEHDVLAILAARGLAAPGDAAAAERARHAQGSVARALAFEPAVQPSADDTRRDARPDSLWDALVGRDGQGGSATARLDAAEAAGKERGDVDVALSSLESRLAEAARASAAGTDTPLSWRAAQQLLDRVQKTRAAIAQNASIQLALEELLLSTALPARPPGR